MKNVSLSFLLDPQTLSFYSPAKTWQTKLEFKSDCHFRSNKWFTDSILNFTCNVVMNVTNERKGIFAFYSHNFDKKFQWEPIDTINISFAFYSNNFDKKFQWEPIDTINTINIRFSLDLISCFWLIYVDFQNEAADFCFNNSINKDVKRTFMVSLFNLKS